MLDEHPLPSSPGEPWVNLFPDAGTAPRSAETIRAVLQAIAESNKEIQRQREADASLDVPELRRRNDAIQATHARSAIKAAWSAADSAGGKQPLAWPTLPPGFVGLCLSGPLGENTRESVGTILDFHLNCGHARALDYPRQVQTGEPFLIATDRTTARWLAADLRGIGLQAEPSAWHVFAANAYYVLITCCHH